jgi:glycerate-2-kinase
MLERAARTLVIAVGKAAVPMARSAMGIGTGFVLSPNARSGDVTSLADYRCLVGGHPVPTFAGLTASRRILEAASSLGASDALLVLLSGGASSLFEVPVAGLSDHQARDVYRALVGSGLAIEDINAIRSALSQVKAGRLARAAEPASVVTLAISDVVGDDPVAIGSGPTVMSRYEPSEVRRLIERVSFAPELTTAVGAALTMPPASVANGHYHVVASARDAADGACASLRKAGYKVLDAPVDPLLGKLEDVAQKLAASVRSASSRGDRLGPWCMVAAGETTVEVPTSSRGDGGRNRHLACRVAALLEGLDDFAFLAAGTDGIDGSRSAAGALVDGATSARMRGAGLDIHEALGLFDTGSALAVVGDDIVTGASATNVGDVVIAVGVGSRHRGSP